MCTRINQMHWNQDGLIQQLSLLKNNNKSFT